ncbi:MAG: hypothetical protein JJT78_04940 [Leptospira sp.]|nr:hypothetical protein [Leptospira sp.]
MSRLIILAILFIFQFPAVAQDTAGSSEPGKESREELAKKNQASYLEKSQYRNISFVFKDKLLDDMRLLNTIVGNFGADVPGSQDSLNKIKQDYQNAVRYHYRRAYVISGKSFLEIYKNSEELFKQFALLYEKQAEDLLISCADELTSLETAAIEEQKPDPRKSRFRDVEDAKFKMKIAFFQMAQGDEMIRDKRYSDSLIHFRIAKDYSLKILSDLELDEAKRKEKMESHKKHLADNRNQLFASSDKN